MWEQLLLSIIAVTVVVLGSLVITRRRRADTWAFSMTMLGVAGWSAGLAVFLGANSIDVARIAAVTYYISAAAIGLTILFFSLAIGYGEKIINLRTNRGLIGFLITLPFLAIAGLFILLPDMFINKINLGLPNNTIELNSSGYAVYVAYFLFYYGAATAILLISAIKSHKSAQPRLWSLFVAYAIGGAVGMTYNLILPALGNYNWIWVGPTGLFIFVPTIYATIVKLGLFDIRRATARATAYLLTLATLLVIYYLLLQYVWQAVFSNVPSRISVVNAAVALILAVTFQPIKRFFDKITNFIFYRDGYQIDEFFTRMTRRLSKITDLETLLNYSINEISQTLKASFGIFVVYRQDGRPFFVSTAEHKRTIPERDIKAIENYFVESDRKLVIVAALNNDDSTSRTMARLLTSHRIALVLPLFQENKAIGYLFLGDHLSSQYSNTDIRALRTIADELTIAIENALSIQEVRDLNATLQQRIDNATRELRQSNAQLQRLDEVKDEFMSMASHQLRTPLTTVKGYISMVLEGDAGPVSADQKRLLNEAFASSERMVRLIGDFLNVSRLQTGKFIIEKQPTNLAKVVSEEIEGLAPNAAARGLKFRYHKPSRFPTLNLDETKIRQVIMNFSDNAIYYSKDGGSIDVTLKVSRQDIVFTVKDHGIGVPADQQAQLFQKFFRATNARKQRPDGTGVGLFLAKRVIDGHGGKIIFESQENKGSTFGFSLPIAKLKISK